jgi:hypothetical protein
MLGTRPGMTIAIYIKNLRHGRACPDHPRPAGFLIDWLAQLVFPHPVKGARLDLGREILLGC